METVVLKQSNISFQLQLRSCFRKLPIDRVKTRADFVIQ